MPFNEQYEQLLLQYEIIRARLEIREHFLKTVVKEVYENIGQVLSLIRVQLSLLRLDFETGKKEKIDSSGEMVGKTIRDLRSMCQLFYPEADLVTGAGFNRALEQEIKILYPRAKYCIDEKCIVPETIAEEKGLVLFGILLEIFTLIGKQQNGMVNTATLKYNSKEIHITIDYKGQAIERKKAVSPASNFDLTIFERTELIKGYLEIKNTRGGYKRVKLVMPIN